MPVNEPAGRSAHFTHQKSTYTKKVMVFLGIRDDKLFGFTFLDNGKLTGQKYKQLLVRNALPEVRNGNGGSLDELWWQQVSVINN